MGGVCSKFLVSKWRSVWPWTTTWRQTDSGETDFESIVYTLHAFSNNQTWHLNYTQSQCTELEPSTQHLPRRRFPYFLDDDNDSSCTGPFHFNWPLSCLSLCTHSSQKHYQQSSFYQPFYVFLLMFLCNIKILVSMQSNRFLYVFMHVYHWAFLTITLQSAVFSIPLPDGPFPPPK